jgi:hypothetical protein
MHTQSIVTPTKNRTVMNKWYSLLAIISVVVNEGTCFSISSCSMMAKIRCTCCQVPERPAPDPADGGIQSIQSARCCNHRLVTIGNQTEFLQEQSVSAGDLGPFFVARAIAFVSTPSVESSTDISFCIDHAPPPRENLPILNSSLLI